ncbi:FERM and PDZ domain-containing protein 1 [Stegostoma tigrinum]|uniref:FERM and PDZ domain-containing protein 1 n=1 Tax=Stegostoma tigrinum TaxID=3053191 RepID=UPI00287057FD|nr:FERM and PDZ domain-containing protein 1 [Stegostoma tigrinum]XP_048382402.2 FERM and PDZ domain-containing protein 1 [Stegostoma tigrinum]
MEEQVDNMVQARKSHKVEQMVSKWLRLTRDSSQRNRGPANGATANTNQLSSPLKVTVKIIKDPFLDHGFVISEDSPVCVRSVTAGGPGEGKLFPGDQIVQINNMPLDMISQEHIDNIIRECGNTVTVTVLRNTSGPKSSFITEEKRARLKSNPVKVRFAEEVIVNGHTQGNSLLFMPSVLKVYLENGQTKAFRYEKNTTVKDIILTLKSKLSIRCIEHFALVLKERYSITKVYLLHDDEIIEQVVQKREPRDYRCLFRVCFLPRDPLVLLQEDPVAFEYLYSQSCNDVLQEKFAMEMKCNTAIRLAALQIQECILSSKQSQKVSMKYIEKDWGIENFVSPTLLHNMREKDIRKAINYHLKNNHSLVAPGQKQLISAAQVRLNYLNILSDLRTYGGKTFNATLLLQDRESFITLLVGAQYGISQVINSKLNIINQLTNFNNIRKLELTFECEKVSMVSIYLVDVKSLTLLLESHHAKDLVCLIAGYHRLYVNSTDSIFTWPSNYQSQTLTSEEGDEARGLSDSESSSDIDSSLDLSIELHKLRNGFIQPLTEENEDIENSESEATDSDCLREDIQEETSCSTGDVSDLNDETTSQGGDICERSCSAYSMDELQTETSMSSTSGPHSHGEISDDDDKDSITEDSEGEPVTKKHCNMESEACFEQHSTDSLISTQTLSEFIASDIKVFCSSPDPSQSENPDTAECCNQCPSNDGESHAEGDGSWSLTSHGLLTELPPIPLPEEPATDRDSSSEVLTIPILHPPPGFQDSSSDDEFFDAAEKFTDVERPVNIKFSGSGADVEADNIKGIEMKQNMQISRSLYGTGLDIKSAECIKGKTEETKYTTTRKIHFASSDLCDVKAVHSQCHSSKAGDHVCCYEKEHLITKMQQLTTFCSLTSMENEPALLETKPIGPLKSISTCANKKVPSDLMEMEPDTMETKSVTEAIPVITTVSARRYPCDSDMREGCPPYTENKAEVNTDRPSLEARLRGADCCGMEECSSPSGVILEFGQAYSQNLTEDEMYSVTTVSCADEQQTTNTISMKDKEHDKAIVKNNTVQQMGDKHTQWVDMDQSGTVLRQTLCQVNSKENMFKSKELVNNCQGAGSCYQNDDGSITSQIYSVMSRGDQTVFSENSELEEEISSRRNSSETGKESKDAYSFDISRPLLNLNRVSFKTFGMVKHLGSPHLETKVENCSAGSLNISECNMEPAEDSSKEYISKTEQYPNQTESRVSPTTANVNEISTPILCPEDKNLPWEIPSLSNTSTPLCEVDSSIIQKSTTAPQQSECLSTKCPQQIKYKSSLNVDSTVSAVLTTDMDKDIDEQLPMGGKNMCSCQIVYGNCFRAQGTDANDENKDVAYSTQQCSPKTTPPDSGSYLSQYITTCTGQSEKTVLTNCSFDFPKTDLTPMLERSILSHFKNKKYSMPNGFRLIQSDIMELLNMLKEFPRESHVEEECAILTSSTQQKLYTESGKLMSACQKGIKVDQAPVEMLLGVSESFQALVQLTATCLQFTTCMHCAERHVEVVNSLTEVFMIYKTFVQISEEACIRKSDDLSMKLLAQQCTALTSGVFCLTQPFK